MQYKICIIIPCYNEAQRLNFSQFRDIDKNVVFIFVNDGSKDNTLELLNNNKSSNMLVLNILSNVGKAEAVRRGVLYIQTLKFYNDIEWIGFWDADLATPLYEVDNFIKYIDLFSPNSKAVFGSRIKKLGSKIERFPKRHYLGRMFATIISILFNINVFDSQCGAKLFKKEIIDKVFYEPFVSRWIFDVEIILRMNESDILEYPLKEWKDISGGALKVRKVMFITIKDLLKLYVKYKIKSK